MPNNAILALFYVLSEISMAFSRPEDLATLDAANASSNRPLLFPPYTQGPEAKGKGNA